MRLEFPRFDGRSYKFVDVVDANTGRVVGFIKSKAGSGIYVSLFDDKYTGSFDDYSKCWGFVQGVEAVLNHLVFIPRNHSEVEVA